MVSTRKVIVVFFMLGFVSLFADIVYEGARSVSGAYLSTIGSPPIGPAIVGAGELVGYVMRLLSGLLAYAYQSSAIVWGFTIAGYAVTAFSIPMLALAPSWQAVAVIYAVERAGKGLRAPTRDVITAEVSEGMGLGKGFGIHELLDQLGAFVGPLFVAFAVATWGYRIAFAALAIPGLVALTLVLASYKLYPLLKSFSVKRPSLGFYGLSKGFWLYTASTCILALGFMHWAIASYYLKQYRLTLDYEVGLIYAVAMLVDALVAVPLGVAFDKIGYKVLLVTPLLSFAFVLLLLYTPRELQLLIAIPWGIVACSEESIMRAAVARLVEPSSRPSAYGIYGMLYGLSWTLGGFILSYLVGNSVVLLAYCATTSIASAVLLLALLKTTKV